jgi:hypothetical protein
MKEMVVASTMPAIEHRSERKVTYKPKEKVGFKGGSIFHFHRFTQSCVFVYVVYLLQYSNAEENSRLRSKSTELDTILASMIPKWRPPGRTMSTPE